MQKVIVVGCPGAGKSTFARKLRVITGLPLYYLDKIWHKADGTHIPQEEFDSRLRSILCGKDWIIDGNYLRTFEMRLRACDTVFLLDYPLERCLAGAESRIGKSREDMPWIETEMDMEFRQWILDFPKNQLPRIYSLLERWNEKDVFVFHSDAEAERYLSTLTDGKE